MSGTTAPTGALPTYDFDPPTLREIAALMMVDADFLRRADGLVEAAYFPDEVDRGFVEEAIAYWAKHRDAPTRAVWVELVRQGFISRPARWRDALKPDVVNRLREVFSGAPPGRGKAFLLEKIEEFAQHQAVVQAMIASAGDLGKIGDPERFDKIKKRLDKALRVTLNDGDDDYDFFERVEERTEERLAIAAGGAPKTGITTGIRELDELLMHGGWGRRELSLFMGAAKAGKSFNLTAAAAAASLAGHNVLFVTLENSREIQASRIDAYIAEISMREFLTRPHSVGGEVKKAATTAGALKIRQFPMGAFRPRDLERVLEDYQAQGLQFDLVVIDYLDVMAPDTHRENKRDESEEVYRRVRGIAAAYSGPRGHPAILSATQTNREGAKAAVIHMTHVAEDFNRIRIADLVIGINRTEEERAAGKVRLTIVAARNQRDGITLFCEGDLDKGRPVASVESVE